VSSTFVCRHETCLIYMYSDATVDDSEFTIARQLAKEHGDGVALAARIRRDMLTSLPDLMLDDEQSLRPFDRNPSGLHDLTELVKIRQNNETDRAKKAVRARQHDSDETGVNESVRQKLARGLWEVMRKHRDFDRDRLSTGLSRAVRWIEGNTPSSGIKPAAGNSANAHVSAEKRSKDVRPLCTRLGSSS
jgi:hypothetical protein